MLPLSLPNLPMNSVKSHILFWGILLSVVVSPAQKNLELVGRLQYPFSSFLSPDEILNDVWAYVSQEGHEYALVGTFQGLSIVDLADPSLPKEIHFVPGNESIWRDIKTFGDYAYVSNEAGGGITIVDLSNLPESIESKTFSPRGVTRAHNLYQENGRLFIVGSNVFNGGIVIMDLRNDPWNPEFLGAYSNAYVHDIYVRGNMAYAAEIDNGRLRILNVSSPDQPRVVGERSYPGAFTHNTWLNETGDVCFTTDEVGGAYIIAWKVRDPGNIEELGRIRSSQSKGLATPHNVHVINNYLVSSYYGDGIQIVDANRPENLVEIGYYDTAPSELVGFRGCWGAYPFLPSGLILATDLSTGLHVLRPTYVRASYFEGFVRNEEDGSPIRNVTLEFVGEEALEFTTNAQGEFASGLVFEGDIQVVVSHPDFSSDTVLISLTPGEVTEKEIFLRAGFNLPEVTALPIPVGNTLSLVIPDRNSTYWELIDMSGRRLSDGEIRLGTNLVTISFPYAKGIYNLRVRDRHGDEIFFKVQK